MDTLKLVSVGSSTGVVLPEDVLMRLNVTRGDTLYVSEEADGSIRLTPYDPAFATKMAHAEAIMRRYRNTLHELAK